MKKLLLLVSCACCLKASSQTLFNIDADSMRFEVFTQLIEANSDYFFYYDTAQTNRLPVTIHAKAQSLESILGKIFVNTDMHFAIDETNHVFVTGGYAIQTALPENFISTAGTKTDTAFAKPQMELTGNAPSKEKAKISFENKLFVIGSKADENIP